MNNPNINDYISGGFIEIIKVSALLSLLFIYYTLNEDEIVSFKKKKPKRQLKDIALKVSMILLAVASLFLFKFIPIVAKNVAEAFMKM